MKLDTFILNLLNNSTIQWDNEQSIPPTSICAYDCLQRQFKIQLELKCCWECR